MSKGPSVLTKDELAILKTTAFGPMRFWVTETLPFQDADRSGVLIRGNLRDDREKVRTPCADLCSLTRLHVCVGGCLGLGFVLGWRPVFLGSFQCEGGFPHIVS